MDVNQLAQELDALYRDYNQWRVEMASRTNEHERRFEITEAALPRSDSIGLGPPLPPFSPRIAVPGSKPASTSSADHCHHTPLPPPIYAAPAPSSGFAPLSYPATPQGTLSKGFVAVIVPRRRWAVPKMQAICLTLLKRSPRWHRREAREVLGADCSLADPLHSARGRPVYDMRHFRERHSD